MPDVRNEEARPGRVYPWYVLAVLVLVYVLNFIDRQIVVILAERIKADLKVTDAQLGFLYGTVFAVFFAVFAIPLGRLADAWDRRRLIAWGTAFWSLMTVLSGLARGFGPLAFARLGVGAGEASAAPAAYSLLSDWFPRERRGAVLGFFSSGIFIGAGLGLGIGGLIVDRWDAAFPAGAAPLGLHGWQAAFLVVGLPGLLLALWVRTLREPPRGGFGAPPVARHPHPFRLFLGEMSSVIPPFTLVTLARGGAGPAGLAINVGAASALVTAAAVLTRLLGTAPQWIALAVGLYSVFSWAQGLRLKSRGDFDLVFRNPPLVLSNIGFGLVTFGTYSTSLWIAPLFLRVQHLHTARGGPLLGGLLAAGGWLGATSGGLLADAWHKKTPRGRLYVGVLTAALALPLGFILLSLRSPSAALLLSFPVAILTGLWIGPAASTVQELVPPRLRATASAVYILHTTFLGLALGPYAVGRLSVFTGDLKSALLLAFAAALLATTTLKGETPVKNPSVVMKTSLGSVTMELYPDKAPETVKNFLQYVNDKFYDGTIFHRVIANFMVQGGGMDTANNKKPTRAPIKNEAANRLKNAVGTVAMARTNEPNSATAQFFINVKETGFLDYRDSSPQGIGYCVFGKVTAGMDVVEKIKGVPTGAQDVPKPQVVIESIRVAP